MSGGMELPRAVLPALSVGGHAQRTQLAECSVEGHTRSTRCDALRGSQSPEVEESFFFWRRRGAEEGLFQEQGSDSGASGRSAGHTPHTSGRTV